MAEEIKILFNSSGHTILHFSCFKKIRELYFLILIKETDTRQQRRKGIIKMDNGRVFKLLIEIYKHSGIVIDQLCVFVGTVMKISPILDFCFLISGGAFVNLLNINLE